MLIRQRIYNGLIGVFLAGVIGGFGSCISPTLQLAIISSSREAVDIAEIRELIEAGADVNVTKPDGTTPLLMAAQNGHSDLVTALLAAGAEVNAAVTLGFTPLYMAAQNGHVKIVTALLKAGAEVNVKFKLKGKDHTPLNIATTMGHSEIVKLLREHGAK